MPGAEGNGKALLLFPKRVSMEEQVIVDSMSGNPADARRRLPGRGGVKCATGHALVNHQAPHGNFVTDELNTSKSIRHPHRIETWNVRGLNRPGKLQIVENEMERKKIHLLGLSETH